MKILSMFLVAALIGLTGCAGYQTFNHLARSSDTVALAAGWKQTFSSSTLRITITDLVGTQTTYEPGDPNIRAVINMYPDPLSNFVVSRETGIDTSLYANAFASQINENYTGGDNDWWQTVVFVNLPDNMAIGNANIVAESIDPTSILVVETASSTVEIVPGVGAPNPLSASWYYGNHFGLSRDHLKLLERSSYYQIDFTGGAEIPTAISLEMTHDPDIDNGGVGRAFVVNPRGEMKNIHWVDDGTTAKAIILPATSGGFSKLVDFKFYVGGGVNNLVISSLQAYDQNGNELFSVAAGVTKR